MAHRKWKERLRQALDGGASDFRPGQVRLDNQCDFGKWLYHQVPVEAQGSPHYQTIKQLHASFHLEAAGVLELALQGRRHEAERALGFGSAFDVVSTALNSALVAWHLDGLKAQASGEKSVSAEKTQSILTERAKALARSTEAQAGATQGVPLVVFSLGGETYGVATDCVREIQPLRDVTPVPCTPDFVVGVINIRGSIYSVIDIRGFFGVPKRAATALTKVILVNAAGLEVGILADDVAGATSVPLADIKPPLAAQIVTKEEYIQGVTKEMLIILNLEALLRDERISVREEVG